MTYLSATVTVMTAVSIIFGAIFAAFRWYLKQEKQERDIRDIKEEGTLLTQGVLACLKGLKEQGCNGPVTAAIEAIEKHLNQQAHK